MEYLKVQCSATGTGIKQVLVTQTDWEILLEIAKENGLTDEEGNGDVSLMMRAIARNYFDVRCALIQLIDGVLYHLTYVQWRQFVRNGRPNDITELRRYEDFMNEGGTNIDIGD